MIAKIPSVSKKCYGIFTTHYFDYQWFIIIVDIAVFFHKWLTLNVNIIITLGDEACHKLRTFKNLVP
jgi:hypothetical protein